MSISASPSFQIPYSDNILTIRRNKIILTRGSLPFGYQEEGLEIDRKFGIFKKELLGSRLTVGHMTLDHGIGVRIPASQPKKNF